MWGRAGTGRWWQVRFRPPQETSQGLWVKQGKQCLLSLIFLWSFRRSWCFFLHVCSVSLSLSAHTLAGIGWIWPLLCNIGLKYSILSWSGSSVQRLEWLAVGQPRLRLEGEIWPQFSLLSRGRMRKGKYPEHTCGAGGHLEGPCSSSCKHLFLRCFLASIHSLGLRSQACN